MSNRRSAWIDRRGQRGAESAIDLVIERQVQAGEQVQHLADELIEDSPYQARRAFSVESVEELAQGMRAAGFQGILIVRPHSDPGKRRHGLVQLVYGHRRRIAWRQICAERSTPCLLPVVVREVDDAQLLTIGAQENLQRQDLDPIEEAQIVAWYERLFFDKNQAEIGAMLGKSSDWVSVRSRIYKLPDLLVDRLRQHPRAIGQMLELGTLYAKQPTLAVRLADRVVNEALTVATVRKLVRNALEPAHPIGDIREKMHNRRVGATIVQNSTGDLRDGANTALSVAEYRGQLDRQLDIATASLESSTVATSDLILLEQAAATLSLIASRAEELPRTGVAQLAVQKIEQALAVLRRTLAS